MSAYNGAAPMIESTDVLAAAGSIVQIEARHAAAIRLMNGQPITDGGFDKPLDSRPCWTRSSRSSSRNERKSKCCLESVPWSSSSYW